MSVIEKPSVTCSTTSPSTMAAHRRAPFARVKNETMSSATASSGMTPAADDPVDPEAELAAAAGSAALEEGLVDDAALRHVVEHPAEREGDRRGLHDDGAGDDPGEARVDPAHELHSLFVRRRGAASACIETLAEDDARRKTAGPDVAWGSAARSSGGQPLRASGVTPSRERSRRRIMEPWSAGGRALRRSARSGSRRWSTSSSSAGSSRPTPVKALAWPLLGVLPLFVFGMWLLTVSSSRTGGAHRARRDRDGRRLRVRDVRAAEHRDPRRAVVPAVQHDRTDGGCGGDVGVPHRVRHVPRRGPRAAVAAHRGAFLWVPVLVGPLTLLTTPHVVMPQYIGISGDAIANPLCGALARVGGPRGELPRLPGVAGGRPRPRGARLPCAVRRARGARTHARHRDHRRRLVAGVRPVDVRARHLGRAAPRLRLADRPAARRRSTASSATAHSTSPRAIAGGSSRARRTCSSRSSTRPPSRRPPSCSPGDSASCRRSSSRRCSPSACCRCAAGCSGGSIAPSSATASAS